MQSDRWVLIRVLSLCGCSIRTRGFEKWRPTRYLCTLCDYVYDENRGELPREIKPGTKFEDIPDDSVCPICATDPTTRLRSGNAFRNGFERLNR